MLEGRAFVEDTDMPLKMQIQAMGFASQALDLYDVLDCKSIAATSRRNVTRNMGMDGSVWWDPTSAAFSHTKRGVSYTSHLRHSTSSSSKALHNLLDPSSP